MSSFRSQIQCIFLLLITFTSFYVDKGEPAFPLSGMISLLSFQYVSVYIMDSCSRDTGSLSPRRKSSRKIFLTAWPVGWKRYLIFCIHSASIMRGELIMSLSWMIRGFTHSGVRAGSQSKWWTCDQAKWWMKFINLPSEDYNIRWFRPRSLRVWGSMYRSTPLTSLPWAINVSRS